MPGLKHKIEARGGRAKISRADRSTPARDLLYKLIPTHPPGLLLVKTLAVFQELRNKEIRWNIKDCNALEAGL